MKKMKAILILVILIFTAILVSSCDKKPNFELAHTRNDPNFSVELILIDEGKIEQVCRDLGVQYEANGCAAFYSEQKLCKIYVQPQRYVNDAARLEIIGHELWHCRFGEWHD